jgi:hypothetical protein
MKESIFLLFALLTGLDCLSQNLQKLEWTIALRVVDEAGAPVENAKVWIAYDDAKPGESANPFAPSAWAVAGLTDTNGMFSGTHAYRRYSVGLHAEKEGYYQTFRAYELGFAYDPAKWNAMVTIVLKRTINPIPMYATRIDAEPPVDGKPVGYDLSIGDWVVPSGKGRTSDIMFLREYSRRSRNDYDYKLTVAFPNPGDGIQEFTVPVDQSGSSLKSPHQAPENGYQPQVVRMNVSHPPETAKMDYDPKRNYFFRVRTVLDEQGNVKSALYGKIYGDFMQFTYYLNPTPKDRNVEFAPRRNLILGQSVNMP